MRKFWIPLGRLAEKDLNCISGAGLQGQGEGIKT